MFVPIPIPQIKIGKKQQHTSINILAGPGYGHIYLEVHNHDDNINDLDGNRHQHDSHGLVRVSCS